MDNFPTSLVTKIQFFSSSIFDQFVQFSLFHVKPQHSQAKETPVKSLRFLSTNLKLKASWKVQPLAALHCGNDATHYLCYSVTIPLISQALILVFLAWGNWAVWFWLSKAHKSLNLFLICCCTSCVVCLQTLPWVRALWAYNSHSKRNLLQVQETNLFHWNLDSSPLSLCTCSALSFKRSLSLISIQPLLQPGLGRNTNPLFPSPGSLSKFQTP